MTENIRHTILLVDDEPSVLSALRRDLKDIDAELIATTDVHEALQLFQQHSISLIISDEKMPVLSGWRFLSLARQIAPATIRVLLTAYTDLEAFDMAINRARVAKLSLEPWDARTFADPVVQLLAQYDSEARPDRTEANTGLAPQDESRKGPTVSAGVGDHDDQTR